jgi:Fe-S oxidoreductase
VLPRKAKRVAVVGAGLSGLTLAYDLARKGYGITVHEASDRPGGSLHDVPEEVLPRPVIDAELGLVQQVGAVIQVGVAVAADGLDTLASQFDAVFLATGSGGESFGLELNQAGLPVIDRITYATNREGVFAGGGLVRGADALSPIESISDGRRAAVSVDRFLQNVSVSASRPQEGATTTRLYTDTAGIDPVPAVPVTDPATGYNREDAVREAQRCLQCECLECVKRCEYLKHYKAYPRKYLREIYNNMAIVPPAARPANHFINSCSLCGLCGEICPTDLNMATVIRQTREKMVSDGRMPPSAHEFALRDMAFSNSDAFALSRNRPGTRTSQYVFFPGCQLPATSPEYVHRVYGYLTDQLGDVGLMLRCCGAPADWAGRQDLMDEAMAAFRAEHLAMGSPTVVLACSSCHRAFTEHYPDLAVVSLWTLMAGRDLPAPVASAPPGTVSVHDPCSTRYATDIHDGVRGIVTGLGYRIKELELSRERTECCSYGGNMWLSNRTVAEMAVQRRIAESESDYVTYCAVCRDFFASRGKRSVHLLDLLFGEDLEVSATRRSPGYSERHENRARVKRTLLASVWGEDVDEPAGAEGVQLVIPGEVRTLLDDRLLLIDDLRRVIAIAESTGAKLLNRETGRWLAHHRFNVITYWVEYSRRGETFVIHNAYSHRMHVDEGEGT